MHCVKACVFLTEIWNRFVRVQSTEDVFAVKITLAIALQTMRATLRTRMFISLFACIILIILGLTFRTTSGGNNLGLDRSAIETCQTTLTYALGLLLFLTATATIWTASISLSREIESYSIHLVVTKPCPAWKLWTGKWLGVFSLYASIFLLGAVCVYGVFMWRVNREFTGPLEAQKLERLRLDNELLVGRKIHAPTPPNWEAIGKQAYDKRKAENSLPPAPNAEMARQIIINQLKAQNIELSNRQAVSWAFDNVRPAPGAKILYFRYRVYLSYIDKYQKKSAKLLWDVLREVEGAAGEAPRNAWVRQEQSATTHAFTELMIPADCVLKGNRVVVRCVNLDNEEKVLFQPSDGPFVLSRETSFSSNYARTMMLALFLIGFLAALGCTVSAAFGPPVAVFAGCAYLIIGLLLQSIISSTERGQAGELLFADTKDRVVYHVNVGLSKVFVSVGDLNASRSLIKGEEVEWRRVGEAALLLLLLRGGSIAGLGIWVLSRREFAKEARR